MSAPGLPLSALLSQALVAFTIEFDNEFERQMAVAGFHGAGLSLVVWAHLFQFVEDDGVPVRELAAAAFGRPERTMAMLGCLERWGFLSFDSPTADDRPRSMHAHRRTGRPVRDGYGSGRGIRSTWRVRPTAKGRLARAVWPPLFDAIERRWRARFGDSDIRDLRASLQLVVNGLDIELPDAVPQDEDRESFAPRRSIVDSRSPLPSLLSKALLGLALHFNRESGVPLSLCANLLRVVNEEGVSASHLSMLTGGSPEVSAIGWRVKRYVTVEPRAHGRGKMVRLSRYGLEVHRASARLLDRVETHWNAVFGVQIVDSLRASLQALFRPDDAGRPLIAAGLVPPPGVRRSGDHGTALGILGIVPAEKKRTREMAAQTAAFIEDPGGRLPQYPMWDMNRGFGP